ncbi:hypothetical protein HDU76_012138 [Blyttiomyces sp. JEL0837]|nr:hypothetical protein HDU76_012138 [Blyttiomyces sp. JEL0837]
MAASEYLKSEAKLAKAMSSNLEESEGNINVTESHEKRFLIQQRQRDRAGANLSPGGSGALSNPIAQRTNLENVKVTSGSGVVSRKAGLVRATHAKEDAKAYKSPTQMLWEDYLTIRPTIESFDSLVEEKISMARRQGAFDDIKGRGKPLPLTTEERNPYLSDTEFYMYRMVKAQGSSPEWVSLGKEIEEEVGKLRRELVAIWREEMVGNTGSRGSGKVGEQQSLGVSAKWMRWVLQGPHKSSSTRNSRGDESMSPQAREDRWKKRGGEWAKVRLEEVNNMVRNYNLQAPSGVARKTFLTVEKEMELAVASVRKS